MKNYLNCETTIWSWLSTKDHKRIGVMFLVSVTLFLLVGGVFALILRLEHLTPGPTLVSPNMYNQLFTLHGVVMVWLFLIPAIPAGFGNFFLPIMLGAKDVAFPRLNLASLYIFWIGAILTIYGVLDRAADTGWTFYPPYSSQTYTKATPVLLGVFVLGWSTIITGVNFITTIHTLRAKGMRFMDMPLFAWALYGVSIIQILGTPVLGIILLMVVMDHSFDWGLFDPARGGDPLIYQHIFWFYSHPAVYIMILPPMGVVSEIVTSMAHKNPLSYKAIAYSTFGIAFVGFLTWGHHMFTSGMSELNAGIFGILSMGVAVFSAIKVFTWTGTLYRGSVWIRTPLVYIFAFLFLFIFGGMTGVAVAATSLDVHWHDTYFVVAHFHFIMVGASLTAFLAALHYWWPKITGKMYFEGWGVAGAILVFLGFVGTFFPQFLLGNAGMPRRYYHYSEQFQALNVLSTAGSWVLALGLLLVLVTLIWSLVAGEKAPANPWNSRSYEWMTPSPPPKENFPETPRFVRGPYDYHLPLEPP